MQTLCSRPAPKPISSLQSRYSTLQKNFIKKSPTISRLVSKICTTVSTKNDKNSF